ncbi:hypothetical protein BpHYR1_034110 [Brachionus plicatilis]|uniref:Uncharacterized protein n=1 Tax=Brachionus plicatilis TaxID=10195 RepID=A0A3M7PKD5_BRAPC|nr:hypothetical protein BpHYR1_034110 [Brachionus plicatilis]
MNHDFTSIPSLSSFGAFIAYEFLASLYKVLKLPSFPNCMVLTKLTLADAEQLLVWIEVGV